MPYWTTQDYFDPFPGFASGLAVRRQREEESQNRLAEERRQQVLDQHRKDTEAAQFWKKREDAGRAAQIAARYGIDPIIGPDGFPDPIATTVIGNKTERDKVVAEALGQQHAIAEDFGGDGLQMTPEEIQITKMPEYQKAKQDAAFRFRIERLRHRALNGSGMPSFLDAEGKPRMFNVGDVPFVQTGPDSMRELNVPASAEMEPAIDKTTGKPIPGLWRDSKGKTHAVRGDLFLDFQEGLNKSGTNAPPAATPSAATGATPTATTRYRYNPATHRLEPVQ